MIHRDPPVGSGFVTLFASDDVHPKAATTGGSWGVTEGLGVTQSHDRPFSWLGHDDGEGEVDARRQDTSLIDEEYV
jgi:hypothetical protein